MNTYKTFEVKTLNKVTGSKTYIKATRQTIKQLKDILGANSYVYKDAIGLLSFRVSNSSIETIKKDFPSLVFELRLDVLFDYNRNSYTYHLIDFI